MGFFDLLTRWPVLRQLKEGDATGLGETAISERSQTLEPRTVHADKVVKSIVTVIQGSNMAECHPVGFQWVMEARARGATIIHVDPRFTRTSAMANLHVPLRPGTDIAFLGGLVRYVIESERYFKEYVTRAWLLAASSAMNTASVAGMLLGRRSGVLKKLSNGASLVAGVLGNTVASDGLPLKFPLPVLS